MCSLKSNNNIIALAITSAVEWGYLQEQSLANIVEIFQIVIGILGGCREAVRRLEDKLIKF